MTKENKERVVLALLVLLLLVGWFYWFQYRPAKIRHDCSWIRHYEEARPVRPAMLESELRAKGMLHDCSYTDDYQYKILTELNEPAFEKRRKEWCEDGNRKTIEEYKQEKPAQPAREWFTKASDDEYKFCLHDKGL